MEDKKDRFNYTYSAKQQEAVQKIRQKYVPKEESKLEQLVKLDQSAEQKGVIWSLVIGVIGILIMGGGMSLVMVQYNMLVGIPVGIAGMVLAAVAYPLYTRITKKQREKLAPQILALTDELMGQK